MSCGKVVIGSSGTTVKVGSPTKTVVLDRRTVQKINDHRPRVTVSGGASTVVSNRTTSVVTGGAMGVQGPPGIPGDGAAYVHTQDVAATTWTINHNLGFRPVVELLTVGGLEFAAAVQHTSLNQVVVTMNTPLAGYARLN